jgi:hypothetical protein
MMDRCCPLSGQRLAALPGAGICIETITDPATLPALWLDRVPADHPLLRPEWMSAARSALPDGSLSCCTLARDGDRLLAVAFFEAIPLRVGSLGTIENSGWQARTALRVLSATHSGTPYVVVCGDIIRTDTPGAWFSPHTDQHAGLFHAMAEAARINLEVSVCMVICSARNLGPMADTLPDFGYHRIDKAEPPMKVELDPTWRTFDDYLAAMRPKYRQRARSARKRSSSVLRRRLSIAEVPKHIEAFDALLAPVVEKAPVALSNPSGHTVASLVQALGDHCRVHTYHHEDTLVAFAVSLHTTEAVEGLLVGFDPALNRSLKLYQNILYDFIEEALVAGIPSTTLGRTALEIKSAVGATPSNRPVYIRHPSFLMHSVLGWAAGALPTPSWTPRSPFRTTAAIQPVTT